MKNEYAVTKELYRSWAIENMFKGVRLAIFILWCVLAAVTLVLLFLSPPMFKILYAVMFLFCLYRAFLRVFVLTDGQYKRSAQLFGTENWIRTVIFYEDTVTVADGNSTVNFSYKDITGVREKDNKIRLDTNKGCVIRLYKDAFVNSTSEEFLSFIESKISN